MDESCICDIIIALFTLWLLNFSSLRKMKDILDRYLHPLLATLLFERNNYSRLRHLANDSLAMPDGEMLFEAVLCIYYISSYR